MTAILARPRLWGVSLRSLVAYRRLRWWSRPPFLPLPDKGYIRFRLATVYGASGTPTVADVVDYLDWVRAGAYARRA